MTNFQIDNKTLFKAFIIGAKNVIKSKKELNSINVFPVRDGDTGTNLDSLMNSIVKKSKIGSSIKETLDSISNAALLGSRGNSGLIFSQFIYGFSIINNLDYIDQKTFIKQSKKGFDKAYESIENPVEGTMLTLMRTWHEILENEKTFINDYKAYLIDSTKELKESLLKTKEQLSVLKKYDVVDAGAKGFTLFIEGFVNSVLDESFDIKIDNNTINEAIEIHSHDTSFNSYRYCTEVLIETVLTKKELHDQLRYFGDSLVIGESNDYKRIHIHTNIPEVIIEKLSLYSNIIESKVDDMKKQFEVISNRKNRICIITDSIADLPSSYIDENQIQVFPISILFDNVTYYDKLTIKNYNLFELIDESSEYPKSAAPNILAVKNMLNFITSHYDETIVITVSSKMSAINQVFKNAALEINNKKITVINSYKNSVAEGLIVYEAQRLVNQNLPYEVILNKLDKIIKNTEILVHVDTLDNMVRSGRVKKSLGIIGKILRLKPIVSIDENGEGIVLKKSIGRKSNINKIIKKFKKDNKKYGINKYAIVHIGALKIAETIKTRIIQETGIIPEYISDISSVIAMNSGKGSVAISYIKGDKK